MNKRAKGFVRWLVSFLVAFASAGIAYCIFHYLALVLFWSSDRMLFADLPLARVIGGLGSIFNVISIPLALIVLVVAFFMCRYSDRFRDWCY